MKKPIRLIAALLAVCMLATVFPPVALAAGGTVHQAPDGTDLYTFLQDSSVQNGDIIQCSGLISIGAKSNASDDPGPVCEIFESAISVPAGAGGFWRDRWPWPVSLSPSGLSVKGTLFVQAEHDFCFFLLT